MLLLSGHGSSSRSVTRTLEPVKKLLNIIGHTIGVMDLSPTSGLIPVWRLSPFCARPEIELLSGRVISRPVFPNKADHVSRFFQQHGIGRRRSEEHTSELQSLMRISYAVLCFIKQTNSHEYTD